MVAPGLRITARKPQCVSHNYLKSLHRDAQNRSENPRVGGSIPSLGTINIKGLEVMPLTPFLLVADRLLIVGNSADLVLACAERTDNFDKARNETGEG
jgi:hypothetical protein